MKNIIKDLFYGAIQPSLAEYDCKFKDDTEHFERNLIETFNDSQKELFKSYTTACRNYEREIACNNFKYGFKTACKLIFDGLK